MIEQQYQLPIDSYQYCDDLPHIFEALEVSLENREDWQQMLSIYSMVFAGSVRILDPNPESPFLWWDPFKEHLPLLMRGMVEFARQVIPPGPIDATVCLPSSMEWGSEYISDEDFPGSFKSLVSREPFEGCETVMVRSYTKKANGEKRDIATEPREPIPMYVDPRLKDLNRVLVFDDVIAEGYSLQDVAEALKIMGVKEVYAVAGFSKNGQDGLKELRAAGSPLDGAYACVEVEGLSVDGKQVIISQWWKAKNEREEIYGGYC